MAEMLESAGAENRDQTLLRLAELAQNPRWLTNDSDVGIPFVIIDGKVHDLERLMPRPPRIRERAELHTCQSFLDYITEHRGRKEAVVFFDEGANMFTAILDYHDGDPRWCQHRAIYKIPRTEEWAVWTGYNRKSMSQADFAEFIENNLPDIRVPDGATLLDMVKTMQAKKAVQFESAVRLDNGQVEFVYVEDIRGTATKGKVDVPAEFTIGIPPFRGEAPFAIVARLRYRIGDDKRLVLWYDLVRPHKVLALQIAQATALHHARELARLAAPAPIPAGIALRVLVGALDAARTPWQTATQRARMRCGCWGIACMADGAQLRFAFGPELIARPTRKDGE